MINITKPQHIIPSHGDMKKTMAGAALAQEMVKTAAPIIPAVQSLPAIALSFLMGSIAALLIYLVVELIREKIKK